MRHSVCQNNAQAQGEFIRTKSLRFTLSVLQILREEQDICKKLSTVVADVWILTEWNDLFWNKSPVLFAIPEQNNQFHPFEFVGAFLHPCSADLLKHR